MRDSGLLADERIDDAATVDMCVILVDIDQEDVALKGWKLFVS